MLLYADDILLLLTDPMILQNMIENLRLCSEKWGLSVNLVKSKNMVFRSGVRLRRRE